eukprot:3935853-Rhodomonas_salina.2
MFCHPRNPGSRCWLLGEVAKIPSLSWASRRRCKKESSYSILFMISSSVPEGSFLNWALGLGLVLRWFVEMFASCNAVERVGGVRGDVGCRASHVGQSRTPNLYDFQEIVQVFAFLGVMMIDVVQYCVVKVHWWMDDNHLYIRGWSYCGGGVGASCIHCASIHPKKGTPEVELYVPASESHMHGMVHDVCPGCIPYLDKKNQVTCMPYFVL